MSRHHHPPRETFAAAVARLAPAAADRLFSKAVVASRLRHLARAQGHGRSARLSSQLKLGALRRAAEVCPQRLRVRPSDRPELLSVRLAGRSLHVPASHWSDDSF